MALDRVHLPREFCEQCGCITRAGANLEDFFVGSELQRFEHEGYDVGLGDGLSISDGQRTIFVGLSAMRGGNEFMTWNAEHGFENPWV